jgi:hypothetical protein
MPTMVSIRIDLSAAVLLTLATVAPSCSSSSDNASGTETAAGGASVGSVGGTSNTGGTGAGGDIAAAGTTASGGSSAASAPTWTELYTSYLASGTIGHCVNCHSWASSASSAYDQLQRSGYIDGTTSPPLATTGASILKWFGGTMPTDASPQSSPAVVDFLAWAAAGAQKN